MADISEDATLATLQTQVQGLERDYSDLKENVVNLDRKIDHSFSALNTKLEVSLNSIQNKLDDRSKTSWGVIWTGIGVAVAFLGLVGSLLYLPIKDSLNSNSAFIATMQSDLHHNYVDYREHERFTRELDSTFNSIRKDIAENRQALDAYFARRVDSSVWSTRDELLHKDFNDLKDALNHHGKTPPSP